MILTNLGLLPKHTGLVMFPFQPPSDDHAPTTLGFFLKPSVWVPTQPRPILKAFLLLATLIRTIMLSSDATGRLAQKNQLFCWYN
nr:hypothetical protein CFP56_43336 [Quercus suber]